MSEIILRDWQQQVLDKAINYWDDGGDKHFLIEAAPAAGKTIAGCVIAKQLHMENKIDRSIILAPQRTVIDDWARDFSKITGLPMERITGNDHSYENFEVNICSSWAALSGMTDLIQAICRKEKVLVICDEIHHATIEAAWGEAADSAFADAKYSLILTGTPMRSDGKGCLWLDLI